MSTSTKAVPASDKVTRNERKFLFASSLGAVFEWHDFTPYASLAAIFAQRSGEIGRYGFLEIGNDEMSEGLQHFPKSDTAIFCASICIRMQTDGYAVFGNKEKWLSSHLLPSKTRD